jgi:phosphoenolpyruvate---glycerone phosphotransferase subunit DhaM
MIGIVLVSHSEALANAAMDLALQMVHGVQPPIRIAAGVAGGFGTDATAIASAIDDLATIEGVLVITDLGSAILSSSLALEIRSSTYEVLISDGPFVEATTAAVVSATTGSSLADVAAEASNALSAKKAQTVTGAGASVAEDTDPENPAASAEERLINPMGLHTRPAALLVQTAGEFSADIELTNTTAGRGPVSASSVIGLLSLAASKNDQLRIDANGPDASRAVNAVKQLVLQGFGELS